MTTDSQEQEDELLALQSIFGPEEFCRKEPNAGGEIRVHAELPAGFSVAIKEGEILSQYEISFLPPLLLNFDLPEDYPSSAPPSFTLTCSWLSHTQLSGLAAHLVDIYKVTGGAAVLFTWAQFLKGETLSFLDIRNLLELQSDESQDANQPGPASGPAQNPSCNAAGSSKDDTSGPCDLTENGSPPSSPGDSAPGGGPPVSAPFLSPSQRLLVQILLNDASQQQRRFASSVFDCGVCFLSRLGADCVELPECGHVFCRDCLTEFCKVQITEGNVRGVACPRGDCSSAPTPAQVQNLVGEELFARYDRLLLQNSLERMPDVVYCPRRDCGSAVIREESSKAAMCPACGFAFCVACRKTYHGADECRGEKSLAANADAQTEEEKLKLPRSKEGLVDLWKDYVSGGKERKRLLESRYGRSVLTLTLESLLSEGWTAVNTKPCPNCFAKIEKNGGCNVMHCSRCHEVFCWVCLAKLLPTVHGHFDNGTCF